MMALHKFFQPMTPKLFMANKTLATFNEGGRYLTFSLYYKHVYGFRIYILGFSLGINFMPWK